jgi:hypothetical protein
MHRLLVFNNRQQRPPIMLYDNLYPLKTLVAVPSLSPTPPRARASATALATSSSFSRRSAQSNKKVDCSMFEDVKVSGMRVPVLPREAARAIVDTLEGW